MLTREDLIAQIQARLERRLSDEQLASWAFDRFYACELGTETIEPAASARIAEALDELMFATDGPDFALDDAALHALITRLEQV
jgi:hypothetical protein